MRKANQGLLTGIDLMQRLRGIRGIAILLGAMLPSFAQATCELPKADPNDSLATEQAAAVAEHRAGFTACEATLDFLRTLTIGVRLSDIEARLGGPGVPENEVSGSGGYFVFHWDGPHSFWTVEVIHGSRVKSITIQTPKSEAYRLESDGITKF